MKKEVYKAAARGDVGFLNEPKDVEAAMDNDDLLGLTRHGNNIIHIAAQFDQLDFIKVALDCFPASADRKKLVCGTNSEEETPLHFAAKQPTPALADLLITSYQRLFGENEAPPWRVKDKDGNTPLHAALMNGGRSIHVAAYLLSVGPEVAAYINHLHQTPLHLAVMYNTQGTKKSSMEVINSLNSQEEELSTGNDEYVLLSLINSLLQKNNQACCLCDAAGMTPLLRAAVRSNLPVVDAIINACPESIEVYDPKRKNVLHYIRFPTFLAARKFLEKPEVPVLLIDRQDHDGNTPTHIAVMNQDFSMVRAMVEHNANFAIENKEGVSVQTLFDQFAINNMLEVSSEAQIESKQKIFHDLIMEKENKRGVIKEKLMSNDLYKAVGNGNLEIVREMLKDEEYCLSRLSDGSNIIHLAIEGLHQHMFDNQNSENKQEPYIEEQFIVEALKKYPILFSQTNHHWQTPLHLERFHLIKKIQDEPSLYSKINLEIMNLKGRGELPLPPWTVKDLHGNTILHTAIKYKNKEFAEYLLELDSNLAFEVNYSKQTPLHLICQQFYHLNRALTEKLLIEKEGSSTVYSRDVEGFTPLLRAAQIGNDDIATEIVKKHPQTIRQTDSHARNFFHHLPEQFDYSLFELSETIPHREIEILITQKDDQGNTPFDLAVEKGHLWKAKYLIQRSSDLKGERLSLWFLQHKGSTRRTIFSKGKTSDYFKDFFKSRDVAMLSYVCVEGSKYGVGKEEIKEYMNPMGVVAALLTTITFTAAFTVPGDYNDHGFPNLGKKAAFQVFMFFDVVGMCSSMMVLFCLLWLLSKDIVKVDYEDFDVQFKLVDMTIDFLQISFYATLIAFMTGVYVTTISETPWLAIFTCVLCSLVMLLMRRSHIKMLSVLFTVIPNDPLIIVKDLPGIVRYCFHGTAEDNTRGW